MAEEKTNATITDWAPLAQMSIKKVGCDPKDAVRKNEQVFMCRIFGEAAAVKSKEAKNGDVYSYLIGEFRAVTNEGKRFEAEKLFLPGGIMEKIEASLNQSDGKAIQFGYDIFSTPDNSVTVGYRYAAQSVLQTQATDRLAALAKSLEVKMIPGQQKAAKEDQKDGGKGKSK